MNNILKRIVKILKEQKKTISFMESCTGGFLASQFTNQEGSSEILKVSLITYSNEFKIYFGVNSKTIEKQTEYSNNISEEMARQISLIANSNYGIGVTGKLGKIENDNTVYYSIYNKDNDEIFNNKIKVNGITRNIKKKKVAKKIYR